MAHGDETKELLESYAQTPFYQEFTVVFNEDSLGIEVQKIHDSPIVRRLLRQTPICMSDAEKGGVSVGSLLSAVANISTISMSYDDVLKRIKCSSRPVELTFRRLHAITDPGCQIGRLWQGFLRTWTGQKNGHWTGRFYLLCANGDLQAFVGTDPESMSHPVDQFSIVGCSILWNKQAREKAEECGYLLDQNEWDDIFAIIPIQNNLNSSSSSSSLHIDDNSTNQDHNKTTPLFFRATCSESRSEWIGALATLEVSLTVSVEDSNQSSNQDSSNNNTLSEDDVNNKRDIKRRTRSKSIIDPLAYWPPLTVLKHSLAEKGDHLNSSFIGSSLISIKWNPICLLLLPGKLTSGNSSSNESSHPRLCWYHKAPSNANELPLGQVLLWGVRLLNLSDEGRTKSSESSHHKEDKIKIMTSNNDNSASGGVIDIKSSVVNNDNNDGVFKLDDNALGFILFAANRLIRLKFHYVAECHDWARVLMAVSDTSDTFMPSSSSSSTGDTASSSFSNGYENRLIFYQQTCENVLKGCDTFVPLLAGGAYRLAETKVKKNTSASQDNSKSSSSATKSPSKKKYSISLSTAILRRDFNTVGGQYMLPLCDCFTSDVIFEALTEHCRQSISTSHQSSNNSNYKNKNHDSTSNSNSNIRNGRSQSIATQAGKLLGDLAGSVGADKRRIDSLLSSTGNDGSSSTSMNGTQVNDRILRSISATPLDMGISLPHKILNKYCIALDMVTKSDESWEVLRMKIGLEASEILVRVDEKVTCGGEEIDNVSSNDSGAMSDSTTIDHGGTTSKNSKDKIKQKHRTRIEWMEIGTLYLTDRNLVFLRKGKLTTYRGFETTTATRPIARIIPLSHVDGIEDRGRLGLLLKNAFILTAHLDEQVVTCSSDNASSSSSGSTNNLGLINVSLNFTSCKSSSVFGRVTKSDSFNYSFNDELKAIGGGRIRALTRIVRESLSELIAAQQIISYISSSLPSSSTSSSSTSMSSGVVAIKPLLKPVAIRRRGVGAMYETFKTALALGPKEVWSRGCGAELSEKELWKLEVQSHALSMWTALNLKRRSALMRITGLTLSSLLLCTKYIDYEHNEKQNSSGLGMVGSKSSSHSISRSYQAHQSVEKFLDDLNKWISNDKTIRNGHEPGNMENNEWLLYIANWLTHKESRFQREIIPFQQADFLKGTPSFEGLGGKKREEMVKLRIAYSEAFVPSDFRDNWQLFMSYLDPFVDNCIDVLPGTFMHSLLMWKDPFISFMTMLSLLAIAYHDLVYLFPSVCLFSYSLFLLISGSTIANMKNEENIQNEIRKESTRKSLISVEVQDHSKDNISSSSTEAPSTPKTPITPITPATPSTPFSQQLKSSIFPRSHSEEVKNNIMNDSLIKSTTTSSSNMTPTISKSLSLRNDTYSGSSASILDQSSSFNNNMNDLDDDQVLAIAAAAAARSKTMNNKSGETVRSQFNTYVTSAISSTTTTSVTTSTPSSTSVLFNDTDVGSSIPSLTLPSSSLSSNITDTPTAPGLSIAPPAPPPLSSIPSSSSSSLSSVTRNLQSDVFHNESESSGDEEDVEDEELKEIAQSVSVAAPLPIQEVDEEKDEKEGLIEFMRQMRAHLGRMQIILHRYNKYYLRFRALHLWRDQPSSWILFFALFLSAIWLAIIPHNITFGIITIYSFMRPIRKPLKSKGYLSLYDSMLYQWLDGIPLEAPTHRSTSIAVQMTMVKNLKN